MTQEIINLAFLIQSGVISKNEVSNRLLDILYKEYKENTLKLFLQIQELDKRRMEQENLVYYRGIEAGLIEALNLIKL